MQDVSVRNQQVVRARVTRIALATVVGVQPLGASAPPAPRWLSTRAGRSPVACPVGASRVRWSSLAEGVLAGKPPQLVHFGIADSEAWDVGLPCGGEIDVWIERYAGGRIEDVARESGRAAEITVLEGASPGAKMVVEPDGQRTGSLGFAPSSTMTLPRRPRASSSGPTPRSAEGRVFIDVVAPPPRLILFGAVDIAAPLCHAGASAADGGPYVVDPRGQVRHRSVASRTLRRCIASWPDEAFERLGEHRPPRPRSSYWTHDPKLDDAALGGGPAIPGEVRGSDGIATAPRRPGASGCWPPGARRGQLNERLSAPVGSRS